MKRSKKVIEIFELGNIRCIFLPRRKFYNTEEELMLGEGTRKIILGLFMFATLCSSAGVSGFFVDIKSSRSHYGPGVDSASNRNEYQERFLGVKAAGA